MPKTNLYIEDVAELLGISVATIRAMRAHPAGPAGPPAVKVSRRLVFDRDEVLAWREKRRVGVIGTECAVPNCERSGMAIRDGLCSSHYRFREVTGRPPGFWNPPHRPWSLSESERFATYVWNDRATGCHLWLGAATYKGYGKVYVKGGTEMRAHRRAWELAGRELPVDLVLDHLCRNRLCVNVDHLEAITNEENITRGAADRRAERDRAAGPVHLPLAA